MTKEEAEAMLEIIIYSGIWVDDEPLVDQIVMKLKALIREQ